MKVQILFGPRGRRRRERPRGREWSGSTASPRQRSGSAARGRLTSRLGRPRFLVPGRVAASLALCQGALAAGLLYSCLLPCVFGVAAIFTEYFN